MRIGIDYRMLSAGVNTVNRGMGRYTQQQLREVLRLDSHNEYILLCWPNAKPALILPEIRSASNVSIAYIALSEGRSNGDPNQPERVLRYAEEYQAWIYKQQLDIYHATTPFLLNDTVFPNFNVCPLIINFYDVIPLVFPDQYLLPGTVTTDLYTRAVHFILAANRFIAISKSAQKDAVHYLGFPADRIDVAYPIADPAFRVLSPEAVQKSLCGLRDRTRLPGTFILSVTHLHHSKNIETLLSAYGRLSPRLRQELALVIACHLTEAETEMIRWLASQRGIAEEVIITGLVTDDELVALYNAATLVIHPSRYEGFGLPVLEAMQCGAAVITTTASSLPEVGGDAVVLVDAEDDQEMADVIEALYMEPARREAMKYCGLQQVKKFSPDQLGQNTLDSYHQARQPCPQPDRAGRRPRIALWTPLPPQRSGISDYSVELLAPLARLYDIEVFVDDGYLPSMELWHRYVVEHYQAFERRHAQDPFDVVVYQMGASFYHWYMYEALQKWQGLVVLHDLTWGFVLHAYHSNSQRLRDFRRELLDMEGPQALREFESAERQSADPSDPVFDSFFDRHYMLKRIMEQGLAVMVHMDLAKREVEKLYRHSRVYHVPMGVEDPWRGRPTLKPDLIREQLGLSRTAFVAGVFGIVHRVKRVDVCLEAFHQVLDKQPDARLWIVGEPLDPAYMDQLQARMSGLGIGQHLYFSNRVAAAEFNGLLLACDVVINLRYPSRKQMSATLVRAIAAGKPIIITDIPEWAFLPDSFCWRVAPDSQEVATLSAYLLKLAADTALRQRMSASARSYYEQNCTAAYMAARYQSVIEQVTGYSSAESHDANH